MERSEGAAKRGRRWRRDNHLMLAVTALIVLGPLDENGAAPVDGILPPFEHVQHGRLANDAFKWIAHETDPQSAEDGHLFKIRMTSPRRSQAQQQRIGGNDPSEDAYEHPPESAGGCICDILGGMPLGARITIELILAVLAWPLQRTFRWLLDKSLTVGDIAGMGLALLAAGLLTACISLLAWTAVCLLA